VWSCYFRRERRGRGKVCGVKDAVGKRGKSVPPTKRGELVKVNGENKKAFLSGGTL